MWITWNARIDQRAWDSVVWFDEARCASTKLKPVPSISLDLTDRLGHKLRDLCGPLLRPGFGGQVYGLCGQQFS